MAKKKRKNPTKKSIAAADPPGPAWLWPGLAFLVILGGIGLLIYMSLGRSEPPAEAVAAGEPDVQTAIAAESAAAQITMGRGNYCQRSPGFPGDLGFGAQTYVGTSLDGYMGLTLSDTGGRVYQDLTWDDAGFLGPFVYDRVGNIYTAPAPFVNLVNNPPEEQNKIYRVDTTTAKMNEWADLPPAQTPTQNNPFGVLGLFYDCDTESIYAGSVAGSTATEELGRIFRVDRATGEVTDMYENVDAMGVGVFNGVEGKRLYFGSGRDSGIRSIALDEAGHFVGEPEVEFYLAQFDEGGNEKAQRITFDDANQMIVKGIDFNYNLRAASDVARALYTFAYDPNEALWNLVSVERVTE